MTSTRCTFACSLASRTQTGAWTTASIVQADPGLADGVHALLGTLESHGLIESSRPVPPGGASRGQAIYQITGAGQAFLARLADDLG